MKSVIVEIQKDHCILLAPDGRFLRKEIPAGIYELGDEIQVEEFKLEPAGMRKLSFNIFPRLAAGIAAVIVLVIGTYFGVKYIMDTGTASGVTIAAVKSAEEETETMQEMALSAERSIPDSQPQEETSAAGEIASVESPAENSTLQEDLKDSSQESVETGSQEALKDGLQQDIYDQPQAEGMEVPQSPVLFEAVYSLDSDADNINAYIPVDYPGLSIKYKVEKYLQDNEGAAGDVTSESPDDTISTSNEEINKTDASTGILYLDIKNIAENTMYSGNITVLFLDKDGGVLTSNVLTLMDFDYENLRQEKILLMPDYKAFILNVSGEIKY